MPLAHGAQHILVYNIVHRNYIMQMLLLSNMFYINVKRKAVFWTLRNYVMNEYNMSFKCPVIT